MRDLALLLFAGYVGWWLATEKEEETRKLLAQAEEEAWNLKNQLIKEARQNEELNDVINGIGSMTNIPT